MILSRLVKPRARRIHDMVASVPLLTIRTFSIDGIQSNHIVSTVKHYAVNDQENGRANRPHTAHLGNWVG